MTSQLTVNETDSVCVMCKTECQPQCNVSWTGPDGLKDNQDGVCFFPVTRNHNGTYSFISEGDVDRWTANIDVVVQCKTILDTYNKCRALSRLK